MDLCPFETIDVLTETVPDFPIPQLPSIVERAAKLLSNRTHEEINNGSKISSRRPVACPSSIHMNTTQFFESFSITHAVYLLISCHRSRNLSVPSFPLDPKARLRQRLLNHSAAFRLKGCV
jgi:hypothetical protein